MAGLYYAIPREPDNGRWAADIWLLFIGGFILYKLKLEPENGGCSRHVVTIRNWLLAQA